MLRHLHGKQQNLDCQDLLVLDPGPKQKVDSVNNACFNYIIILYYSYGFTVLPPYILL